ncbi:hypothetical protein GIB67_027738 [Kingdonia uniflora]|uniref:Peptidase S8/S53 domain-containing protein n=1 Tax=Kingdonia uniflora TaxID=39325 RepID=A0A7J7PCM3_9MAGN|nr:hypothetical protein GIB67_027738 [Kingdonia uniflora]
MKRRTKVSRRAARYHYSRHCLWLAGIGDDYKVALQGEVMGKWELVMDDDEMGSQSSNRAAQDGVDIVSLSITPNRRPLGIATFFNPIDMALLSAVRAGIFVVQAAGNTGPSPKSISSFSPWIFTVGAASHDRVYNNSVILGNNITISGVGLAPGTDEGTMFTLVSALHALNNDTASMSSMYLSECQDSTSLNQDLVQGNLLICSYSIRFVLGLSTIKQALKTAKNLSAAGILFCMDPFILGFQLNPTPMELPGIIIPSSDDSKVRYSCVIFYGLCC